MRRLHRGMLAAAVVLGAGCGTGGSPDGAAPAPAPARPPALAAATRALPTTPAADRLTVLVTSPDGVGSPGLDAAVAVLLERPELHVVVAAPTSDRAVGLGSPVHRDPTGATTTASGYPATAIDAPAAELVATAGTTLGIRPDLVIVGFTGGTALGPDGAASPSADIARGAADAGIPTLAVTMGVEHGADVAAAGLMLRSLLDIDLDAILTPGTRLLNVPSCRGGVVRGPVEIAAAADARARVPLDCEQPEPGEMEDDIAAYQHGFATLVEIDL